MVVKLDTALQSSEKVYEYKFDEKRKKYGFSAQEIQKIFPEVVYEDDAGILSIDYIAFIPLILEGMKIQQAQIEELQKEVDALKKKDYNEAKN